MSAEAEPGLDSPVIEKIAWADECYQDHRERLLGDARVADLVGRVKLLVGSSREVRSVAGIAELCADCESRDGGSCCGTGLEDRYDGRLLLVNRLCGVDLPRDRFDAASCHFMGARGCVLEVRHVICVNYVCRKIERAVSAAQLREVREAEGEELESVFRLHARVTELVRG